MGLNNLRIRNGDNESPSGISKRGKFFHDLLSEIPCQYENEVRTVFIQPRGRDNRDVSSRGIEALLGRTVIDNVIQLLFANAKSPICVPHST